MAFQVIPPNDDPQTNNANWRNLNQNISAGYFNPVPTSGGPTITGTGLLIQGYFSQVITGVVHYNITFTVTSGTVNFSWANGTYLLLPAPLGQLGAAGGGIAYAPASLCGSFGGAVLGVLAMQNNGKNGVIANNTGATITAAPGSANIQGFYFTGK